MKKILFLLFFFLTIGLFADQVFVWQTPGNRLRMEILHDDGSVSSFVAGPQLSSSDFEAVNNGASIWLLKDRVYFLSSGDNVRLVVQGNSAVMPALSSTTLPCFWLPPTDVKKNTMFAPASTSKSNLPYIRVDPTKKTVNIIALDAKGAFTGTPEAISYTEKGGILSFTYRKTGYKYLYSVEGNIGFLIMLSGNSTLASIYKLELW
ncbi:MAG: hypothetical protein LBC76_01320 [Treponema sp.]|jgi:hypothetical protein|nr:hypothetical protein [Treponema sp.]